MNATEEWLRYVESQVIMQKYGIKGYTTGSVSSSVDTTAASYNG